MRSDVLQARPLSGAVSTHFRQRLRETGRHQPDRDVLWAAHCEDRVPQSPPDAPKCPVRNEAFNKKSALDY